MSGMTLFCRDCGFWTEEKKKAWAHAKENFGHRIYNEKGELESTAIKPKSEDLVWEFASVIYQHRDVPSEAGITKLFFKMERDEKPAVHIEIYDIPVDRVVSFKMELERLGYFVFMDKHAHLCVSKLRSVAYWLCEMSNNGFYKNAGAVGIILGIPLVEVIAYVRRTGEDEIRM